MYARKIKSIEGETTKKWHLNPKDTNILLSCLREADAIRKITDVYLLPMRQKDIQENWIYWREWT